MENAQRAYFSSNGETPPFILVISGGVDNFISAMNGQTPQRHLHLVSDATGETISSITRACLAQFENTPIQEHFWSLIKTKRQLDIVLEGIRQWPGMVLYTFVDETLRKELIRFCKRENTPSVSVLEPVMQGLSEFLGTPSTHNPGRQHVLDATYFSRIDAINYALATDDGNRLDITPKADVIILGVSRTSKTPTCVYLANRGILTANIPIIPGMQLPLDPTELEKPLIVGLTKDPEGLVEIRQSRMRQVHEKDTTNYSNLEKVREEVHEARRLFARLGCPVIDISRRSVEETASEIMMLLNKRSLEQEHAQKGAP
jgi:[pyruvate, water dikinase]-phosphate phosphotransferase / [pyruvate, water dikinase] kinase